MVEFIAFRLGPLRAHGVSAVFVRRQIFEQPRSPLIQIGGEVTGANSRARNCTKQNAAVARLNLIKRLRERRPSEIFPPALLPGNLPRLRGELSVMQRTRTRHKVAHQLLQGFAAAHWITARPQKQRSAAKSRLAAIEEQTKRGATLEELLFGVHAQREERKKLTGPGDA